MARPVIPTIVWGGSSAPLVTQWIAPDHKVQSTSEGLVVWLGSSPTYRS